MFNSKSIDIVTFEFGGCNIDTRTFFKIFGIFLMKPTLKSSELPHQDTCILLTHTKRFMSNSELLIL